MAQDPFDLSGRVALVSGASRGIGRAIAHALAARGAHVVVTSRKAEACEAVVGEIRAAGGSAEAFGCHIGEVGDIERTFAAIDGTHGRVDLLVNNAATNPYYGHVLDMDLGAFQKTLDVNIRGYFLMSVEAGRRMRRQGRGAILNVASVNAVRPGDRQAVYSMTKAAIVNMTQAFAKECGPLGIRVNALLPGITETRFATALHTDPGIRGLFEASVPLRRIGQPTDMAGAAVYLLSDAAAYTTGATLVVDGGWLVSP